MLNLLFFYCFFAIVIYIPVSMELTIIVYSILGSIVFYNVSQNKAPAHTKRNRIISVIFFLALSSIIYFLAKISGMEIINIFRLSAVIFIPITILLAFTLPILGAELAYGISKFKAPEHIIRNSIIAFLLVYNAQLFYVITIDKIENWYGISYDRLFYEHTSVNTPHGKFSAFKNVSCFKVKDKSGGYYIINIDSVAEYDQSIVVVSNQDSSYIYIDNQSNITMASSLSELQEEVQQKDFVAARKYTEDLYWKVHNDNYLYVVKGLIAILLSMLATTLEFFLFRIVRKRIRSKRVKCDE